MVNLIPLDIIKLSVIQLTRCFGTLQITPVVFVPPVVPGLVTTNVRTSRCATRCFAARAWPGARKRFSG